MKFLKGMLWGTVVSNGVMIMMKDNMNGMGMNLRKQGKKFVKKIEKMM